MREKEFLQPNKLTAPVLFVGVGGTGSNIVKRVADRCLHDDTDNIRFVIMDTDVNDLSKTEKGAKIIAVQTSSTSTVEDFLKDDTDAKENWFPENKMLDPKAVSEGAGQIRAISRLALNASIKIGKIHTLYQAIDELFLKDGGGLKQAIRVVIVSTATGGTGSGIAMEAGMLIRHYVKKNYPESAVMIRGFLLLPSVMDTVLTTESEKNSQRCNGYATIKEINAFMMKGSGFFDTVPELNRYKDLHLSIPGTDSTYETLDELPFDFCFLLDRTDANEGNMPALDQYKEYAAQSLYEQNIGSMRAKTASMEDNILKLCIDPERLGRCRFGGVGASVLRYPYEKIRDYIALDWTRRAIIGSSTDASMTEAQRNALLANSWLQFDMKYAEERRAWEDNPSRSAKNEPSISKVYRAAMEGGKDPAAGNDFTSSLWARYITPKVDELTTNKNTTELANAYIEALVKEVIEHRLVSEFSELGSDREVGRAPSNEHYARYEAISNLYSCSREERVCEIAKNFAREVFSSKASIEKEDLGAYMLEKYLSLNGKAIHPNAARLLLYELRQALETKVAESKQGANETDYTKKVDAAMYGPENDGKRDIAKFQVSLNGAKENSLGDMCEACDKKTNASESESCSEQLGALFSIVEKYLHNEVRATICDVAIPAVNSLIKAYEDFYATFEGKTTGIERKQEDIVTSLRFKNGDCQMNVFSDPKLLSRLTRSIPIPADAGNGASTLYAKIFNAVRENAYLEQKRQSNPFAYVVKKDIFDETIIEYYKARVTESCDTINVPGILQALKLEYSIKAMLELDETPVAKRDKRAEELHKEDALRKYIMDKIKVCDNLASPGVKKNQSAERREVDVIACSSSLADGAGLRVSDFIPDAIRADSVSRDELRFFRSVYNIMPTELAKFRAPSYNGDVDEFTRSADKEYTTATSGDYFCVYQKYMDRIGPDCKASAIITPHVDMRWNAISVMPELDLEFQKHLMRKIHKSMIYGFIYKRILLKPVSDERLDERVYRYLNTQKDEVDLIVSNKTRCDALYEVLDALYFDRIAVASIREQVHSIREKSKNEGHHSFSEMEFFNRLSSLHFRDFVNEKALNNVNDRASIFSIILLYCNSLPVQNKDAAEMKIMAEAVLEMILSEMKICVSNRDSLLGQAAKYLIEQFNCLLDNYDKYSDALCCGIFSDKVVSTIRRCIWTFLEDPKKNLDSYFEMLPEFDEGEWSRKRAIAREAKKKALAAVTEN